MKEFSKDWKSSKKPKKQKKYRKNAPLHLRGRFLNAHLSKKLSEKYNKRSIRVRTGDKVEIMKGSSKGESGKVEKIDTKNQRVVVEGVEFQKSDGTKIKPNIAVSNVMITDLDLKDEKRQQILERK